MKKRIQAWRSLTSWYLVLLGSGEGEATSAGRARFCMAPLPPFLSLCATISSMSSTQLLLQMLPLPHPALEFRMQRYFEHLMQVVCVSRTLDLEDWFPLITLCSIVHEIHLTTRDEVKNDVIVMEPLISTVTVNIQVENCNNSSCSHLHRICTINYAQNQTSFKWTALFKAYFQKSEEPNPLDKQVVASFLLIACRFLLEAEWNKKNGVMWVHKPACCHEPLS